MHCEVERQKGKVKFSFKLDAAEWEKAVNDAYLKTKNKYQLGGFRKGKAPRKIIEHIYGPSVFFEDAFNNVFPKLYAEALDKEPDIYPVSQPDIDFQSIDGNGAAFTAEVFTKPEVKLGAYKGLACKLVKTQVGDAEADAEIEKARERVARKVEAARPIRNGDFVTLDYSGSVGGEKFKGGTAEKQELEIGGGSFIPGFEDKLIGAAAGEEKDIAVTFPADYHAKDLAGKEAVFHCKIHEVKQKELPAPDDDFAKDVSSFDTFKEYKDDVLAKLILAAEKKDNAEMENEILEKVVQGAEADIPPPMIDSQLDSMLKDFEYRLMYQGMKLEDYFKYTKTTAEGFKKDRAEDAKKAVMTRLTIEAILKAEDIKVEDADIDGKIQSAAAEIEKPFEEYKNGINARELDYIKNDVLMEKFIAFLKANNKFA
ncbi:MAG: trigger factor [Clostridiales bacterium]|jgi:trigger factor|nr:trigger factor [Clostridiales bacterium]